jgi:hypothetical protein
MYCKASAISSCVLYCHGLPATGPPGRLSAIPPSWATMACWFRTMSLVYLFGISPTVAPGELQDRHLHPLCLVPDEFICHSLSSSCVWMLDLCVPPMSQSAIHGRLCDGVFCWARSLGSVGSYHEIHRQFNHVVPSRVKFVV